MSPSDTSSRDRFFQLVQQALEQRTLAKLTLGKYRGAEASLQNVFIRPVQLKGGAQLSWLWRHATRDVTKNHPAAESLALLQPLIGSDFLDAHLFTSEQTAQLETQPDGRARLRIRAAATAPAGPPAAHDRAKSHLIPASARWLKTLGVTNDRGQPREGMADKFRQIQKFSELLSHLLPEAFPERATSGGTPAAASELRPLQVVDMGSGKGYLTFALATLLGRQAQVRGIEARPELVELCNRAAREHDLAPGLAFTAGTISEVSVEQVDVLIALHACDTATDDALAKGLAAGAQLLVVAPCCQKELRPQLTAPPVLAEALRHGIFQERHAEFATDALRALLLEWAGYRTKVFEFISTEHTAKNLMIAAVRAHAPGDERRAERLRDFARFYGIRRQKLAGHLGFNLDAP